jgi:hypothetical protein
MGFILRSATNAAMSWCRCVQGDDGVCAREQWVLCCDPLPEAPEGARLMASEHLPISV